MKGTFWRKFPTSTLIPKTAGFLFLIMKPLRKVNLHTGVSSAKIEFSSAALSSSTHCVNVSIRL